VVTGALTTALAFLTVSTTEFTSYGRMGVITAIGLMVGLVLAPLLPELTATLQSGRHAAGYLSVRVLGSVVFLMLISIQETRQGFGDSRLPMYTTLGANALNIALDYCFIFLLDWGVEGAAWASNLALLCELGALASMHALKDGFRTPLLTRRHVGELWRLGLPSGIQFGLEVSSFGTMVVILAAYSELHTAAHQIAVQVLHFAFLPAFGFSEAGSVLAGQAVGAQRPALVGRVATLTLRLALGYAAACGLVLFFGSTHIISAFTEEPALVALTAHLFSIMAIFQLFDSANLVARGVLRGTGDVRFVATVGILAAWCCTPPMTYLLGYYLGYGVYGAWVGLSGEVAIATVVFWRRLSGGKWQLSVTEEPAVASSPA
jgi:MATE family multidrug resistance protein